jgi:hypothetical protein
VNRIPVLFTLVLAFTSASRLYFFPSSRRYICNLSLFKQVIKIRNRLVIMFTIIVSLSIFSLNVLRFFYHDHEGMSFITFVLNSLCPKGNNDLKDEGPLIFNILCCLVLDS